MSLLVKLKVTPLQFRIPVVAKLGVLIAEQYLAAWRHFYSNTMSLPQLPGVISSTLWRHFHDSMASFPGLYTWRHFLGFTAPFP